MKKHFARISLFAFFSLFPYADCLAQLTTIGVGIRMVDAQVGDSDTYPRIKRVMQNTPAAEANFMVGDIIWSIDGEDLNGVPAKEVAGRIKGSIGDVRSFVIGADKRKVSVVLRQITGYCIEGDCENGAGKMEELNGCLYEGSFFNGKFEGYGEYWHSSEDTVHFYYKGQMVEGKFEGEGNLVSLLNDYRYVGFFRGGTISGEGQVTFEKSNAVYEGYFFQGKPLGPGTMTYPTGETRSINPTTWDDLREATGQEKPKAGFVQHKSWAALNQQLQETEVVLQELAEHYQQFYQKYQEASQKFSSTYVIETYANSSFQSYIQTLDKAIALFEACNQAFFDTNMNQQQVEYAEAWLETLTPVLGTMLTKESNGSISQSTVFLQRINTEWLQERVLKAREVRGI